MKQIIIILIANLLFLNPLISKAQNDRGEEILDQVAEKTASYNAVKIIFSYSMDNEEQNIHENYKGEIISKGDKYHLKVAGQEIFNNGEKVWTYIPEAEEVQLNSISEENTRFNPTQLIEGYREKFDAEFLRNTTEKNRELAVIKLVPKDANETFEKAHLIVDKTRNEIYKLLIFGEMGNKFTYKIEELLPNISVSEDTFRFNKKKHPEVDVIDMR